MACCNCCCPEGKECCKAEGPDGICCDPEKCCGTEETPLCCTETQECCGGVCCGETQECCGPPEAPECCPPGTKCCGDVCCEPGECCVDGVCAPCEECEADEDCESGHCCDTVCCPEECSGGLEVAAPLFQGACPEGWTEHGVSESTGETYCCEPGYPPKAGNPGTCLTPKTCPGEDEPP